MEKEYYSFDPTDGSTNLDVFDFVMNVFPFLFILFFVFIIGAFIFTIIKGTKQWSDNNKEPRLSTQAKVVTKRTSVSGGGETSASSNYFVTFEFPSGDRREFQVKGEEFGQLVEGDQGELHFQGTRYQGFTRHQMNENAPH